MTQRAIASAALITIFITALAHGYSARTKLAMRQISSAAKAAPAMNDNVAAQRMVPVFVDLGSPSAIDLLRQAGASVNAVFGTFATASVPRHRLDDVAKLPGVKHLAVATPLSLCNDMARTLSSADSVTATLPENNGLLLSGKGVIVGMIDVGIDFNHINFRDSNGNSRIVGAYLPCDTTGTPPVLNGMALPGSHYNTPDMVARLTTDCAAASHGTHTTGTAAGCYTANGMQGVAQEAAIVACAMPEEQLSDVNIANSLRYIFHFADSLGMPAVVNMSLAGYDWSHDGTAPLCRVIDELAGPGHIVVVSAGNTGQIPSYITKRFASESDTLKTMMGIWSGAVPRLSGYCSAWTASEAAHDIRLTVHDIKADTTCLSYNLPQLQSADSVVTISSESDTAFARYFTGELSFAAALEDNGLYHSVIVTSLQPADHAIYRLGMAFSAPAGQTIRLWNGGATCFTNSGLAGWTYGTTNMTISDLATTDNAISVGAYCSKRTIAKESGGNLNYSKCSPYDIAYFSSYGPDARGIARPDVAAPGFALVSAANRYDSVSSPTHSSLVQTVDNGEGETFPYGAIYGTSMSAPVVTGTIALWLQINPRLTPAEIRNTLYASSSHDQYTARNTEKWGAGKLNAAAGAQIIANQVMPDVNRDGVISVADVSAIYSIILGIDDTHRATADVNIDGMVTVADVTAVYKAITN